MGAHPTPVTPGVLGRGGRSLLHVTHLRGRLSLVIEAVQRALAWAYGTAERAYWDRTYARYRREYDVDPTFAFRGTEVQLLGDNTITLGARSYICSRSTLVAFGAPISVGAGCRISSQVRIDGRSADRVGPVSIGDDVLVGWNAFILPGVTIGAGAKVGANTVVYRDVPAGGVVRSLMA